MKRFTNILYSPSNRSHDPAALARVVDLATRNSAKLTLFGVVTEPTRLQRLFDRHHLIERTAVAAEQELLDELTSATANVNRDQIEVIVEVGKPGVTIIEHVLTGGHDLVVVNDPNPSRTPSVKRLLRKCPCPVWVIKPTHHRSQRVLAAVDPHPDDADLNRLILELASSMVAEFGGELHVGHAWKVYGDSPDGAVFNFTPVVRKGYRIGVPTDGFYKEVLNSDAEKYGGGNVGNHGQVWCDDAPLHGQAWSAALTLPPLAVLWRRRCACASCASASTTPARTARSLRSSG